MVFVVKPGNPAFPNRLRADRHGLVAVGGVLTPELVCEAYQKSLFPWTGAPPIPWFSPDPRLVLIPSQLHVSRSLAKCARNKPWRVWFDHDFAEVISACAEAERPDQDGTWITDNLVAVFSELYARGIAHVVTVRDETGEMLGGLYGLAFGRAFFGESMFARVANASKIALAALCLRLQAWDFHFIDCQQVTPHLQRMGAVAIPRTQYLYWLAGAIDYRPRLGPWRGIDVNVSELRLRPTTRR
jgi:leucyl/phenylalanyl-tRNA--protein transferase